MSLKPIYWHCQEELSAYFHLFHVVKVQWRYEFFPKTQFSHQHLPDFQKFWIPIFSEMGGKGQVQPYKLGLNTSVNAFFKIHWPWLQPKFGQKRMEMKTQWRPTQSRKESISKCLSVKGQSFWWAQIKGSSEGNKIMDAKEQQ